MPRFSVTGASLRRIRFFDGLDEAELEKIATQCSGPVFERGKTIVRHRDIEDIVYFIVAGAAKATLHTYAGKEISFQVLRSGDMFGEVSALDGEPRSTSVVALVESRLASMTGPTFRDLVASNNRLARRTMLRLCELSRYLCGRAYAPRAYSVPNQIRLEIVGEFLGHVAAEPRSEADGRCAPLKSQSSSDTIVSSVTLDPAPTHNDIAERVGTSRSQVTRIINDLSRLGFMRQFNRRWLTDDVHRLCDHVEELLHPTEH